MWGCLVHLLPVKCWEPWGQFYTIPGLMELLCLKRRVRICSSLLRVSLRGVPLWWPYVPRTFSGNRTIPSGFPLLCVFVDTYILWPDAWTCSNLNYKHLSSILHIQGHAIHWFMLQYQGFLYPLVGSLRYFGMVKHPAAAVYLNSWTCHQVLCSVHCLCNWYRFYPAFHILYVMVKRISSPDTISSATSQSRLDGTSSFHVSNTELQLHLLQVTRG